MRHETPQHLGVASRFELVVNRKSGVHGGSRSCFKILKVPQSPPFPVLTILHYSTLTTAGIHCVVHLVARLIVLVVQQLDLLLSFFTLLKESNRGKAVAPKGNMVEPAGLIRYLLVPKPAIQSCSSQGEDMA